MVRKAIREQRIRAYVPSGGNAVRNSHCLLPDRPRVGHFEYSRSRVKKFPQVGEINMRSHMIGTEIVYGIKRSEINLSGDSLSGFDFQRWLRVFGAEQRYRLPFASSYLKSKPRSSIGVV